MSGDRAVRKAAYAAEGEFYEKHSYELDDIFDKLVKCRTAQARALGMKDYTELGNIRMGRLGYSKEDLENYRNQVKKDLVPAANEIIDLQKKRIGVDEWKGYDNTLTFLDGNPTPKGTPEEIMDAGRQMWQSIIHIMVIPFYYIDYALAQTVAMQMWLNKLKDKDVAWKQYLDYVKQGGTKTFTDLVKDANLISPFEDRCIKNIVDPMMEWIRANQL